MHPKTPFPCFPRPAWMVAAILLEILLHAIRAAPAAPPPRPLWNRNLQTAIGLIDTENPVVRGDGALLEPGGDIGFQPIPGPGATTEWKVLRQSLYRGRFPIVITTFTGGGLRFTCTAYTAPLPGGPCDIVEIAVPSGGAAAAAAGVAATFYGDALSPRGDAELKLGRRIVAWDPGGRLKTLPKNWGFEPHPDVRGLPRWACPEPPADPAFANARAGFHDHPIRYHFAVKPGRAYPVALGLCEGYWKKPGQRLLVLNVEGASPKIVDTVRDVGPNKPGVFLFTGRDVDGNGRLDVTCRAAPAARDRNSILNAVWILRRPFQAGDADTLRRHAGDLPLLYGVDCGGGADQSCVPLLRVTWPVTPQNTPAVHWLAVSHLPGRSPPHLTPAARKQARNAAVQYWRRVYARGIRIHINDRDAEDLFWMSVANVFMLRDRMSGFSVVKPGETGYDSFWYRDGAYLVLAQDAAGYPDEARKSLELFWRRDLPDALKPWGQQPGGAWAAPPNEWDGQGQALWALWRHFQLTGDRAWLAKVYPAVLRGMQWIRAAREKTKTAPSPAVPLSAGLFPKGFGERIDAPRGWILYHDFWGVLGARCAWRIAETLGKPDAAWMKREYQDFHACVARCCAKAAETTRPDHAIPGALGRPNALIWGGVAAVFPCEALPPHAPCVDATFRVMERRSAEGLYRFVSEEKIWPYISTDWARAYLYREEYGKALRIFRAYTAHASPTRAWIEEIFLHSRIGTGDMPHGWAAADYIMLLRDMLVLERGDALHITPCVDPRWLPVGASVRAGRLPTEFGVLSLALSRPSARRLIWRIQCRWRRTPRDLRFHPPIGWPGKIRAVTPAAAVVRGGAVRLSLPETPRPALVVDVRF